MAHGKHVILLRLQLEPHGYETVCGWLLARGRELSVSVALLCPLGKGGGSGATSPRGQESVQK